MSEVSRRAFLRALGLGAAAGAAPWGVVRALGMSNAETQPAQWGRALTAPPVLDALGHIRRMLRPDEITPLRPLSGHWVQLPDGRADRRHLQPIATPSRWQPPSGAGWVSVAAPYAALRRWCAADAPLVARPGWGAVFHADTLLAHTDGEWLGVRLGDEQVWSLASAWRAQDIPAPTPGEAILHLDRTTRRAWVEYAGRTEWRAEAAIPATLDRGEYPLLGRNCADSTVQPGAPWALDFGAWRMTGAYWHNSFADAGYQPFPGTVEIPVLPARALYGLNLRAARIR